MPARACGTIRIARDRTNRTKTANTARTIRPAISYLLVGNEGRRALDLQHLDAHTLLVHIILVVRPRGPLLAADLDPAAVGVDPLENERTCPHERRRAGANRRGRMQVAAGDRPDECKRRERAGDEHDELEGQP